MFEFTVQYKDKNGNIQETVVTVFEDHLDKAKFEAQMMFKKYWSDCELIHIGWSSNEDKNDKERLTKHK